MRGGDAGRVVVIGFLCALLIGGWPRSAAGDAVLVSDVASSSALAAIGASQVTDDAEFSATAQVGQGDPIASANADVAHIPTLPFFDTLIVGLSVTASTSATSGPASYSVGGSQATRTVDFTLASSTGYAFEGFLGGELAGDALSTFLASVTLSDISGSPVELWKQELSSANPGVVSIDASGILTAGTYRILFRTVASAANGSPIDTFPNEWDASASSFISGSLALGVAPPVVPLPAAAMAGLVLVGGIAGARRRCR